MKLPILLTHRLRSTSIGGLAAIFVAAAFFFYHLSHHVLRWDLFAIRDRCGGEDGSDGLVQG